jgi:3-oxoacyl-[acyl-carrier protein] reductase
MDLGIAGKTAIVCASSQGLGRGCAAELARAGCRVIINGRDADRLAGVAEELAAQTGAEIVPVAADVGTPDGRSALLAAAPDPDILINNNAGPPMRDFRDIDSDTLHAGIEANMGTPLALIQAVIDGMVDRRFGRIVNITSGSVKMPLTGLDLSTGARIGLTGFLAGVARSVAHANVTINFLLPGAFDTARLRANNENAAQRQGITLQEAEQRRRDGIPAKRFGTADEFGATCAFLCSAQAGYITGQSVLIDGGAFPGVL